MDLLSILHLEPSAKVHGIFDVPSHWDHAYLYLHGHRVLYNGSPGDFGWIFPLVFATILTVVAFAVMAGVAMRFRPMKPAAAGGPAGVMTSRTPVTGVQGRAVPPDGEKTPPANPGPSV